MEGRYEVIVKVVSQKGTCAYNHAVGDEWVIRGTTPLKGMCLFAFNAIFPSVFTLMFGGSFPWESDPDVVTNLACGDAQNPVVFELRRGNGGVDT